MLPGTPPHLKGKRREGQGKARVWRGLNALGTINKSNIVAILVDGV